MLDHGPVDTLLLAVIVAAWGLMAVLGAFIAEWKGHSFGFHLACGLLLPLWVLVIPALPDWSQEQDDDFGRDPAGRRPDPEDLPERAR